MSDSAHRSPRRLLKSEFPMHSELVFKYAPCHIWDVVLKVFVEFLKLKGAFWHLIWRPCPHPAGQALQSGPTRPKALGSQASSGVLMPLLPRCRGLTAEEALDTGTEGRASWGKPAHSSGACPQLWARQGGWGRACSCFRQEGPGSSWRWGPGCTRDDPESEGSWQEPRCPLRSLRGVSSAHCWARPRVWAQDKAGAGWGHGQQAPWAAGPLPWGLRTNNHPTDESPPSPA